MSVTPGKEEGAVFEDSEFGEKVTCCFGTKVSSLPLTATDMSTGRIAGGAEAGMMGGNFVVEVECSATILGVARKGFGGASPDVRLLYLV